MKAPTREVERTIALEGDEIRMRETSGNTKRRYRKEEREIREMNASRSEKKESLVVESKA